MLVDGTFWRDDELARLGISARSARDMGHCRCRARAGRSRRWPGSSDPARRSSTSTTPTRSCSRTHPSARPSCALVSRLPTTVWRSSCDRHCRPDRPASARAGRPPEDVHRRLRAQGTPLPQPPPVPPTHGRRRADAARNSSAGSPTASTTRSASRSRTRRSCPTVPRSRSGASGSSGSSTTTARPRAPAGSSRGWRSARRSASPARSSSPSGASSPRCATRSTPT